MDRGARGEGPAYDTVDIYHDATGQWSTARRSEARGQIASLVVGTRAIFAGGLNDSYRLGAVVDIYDAATGRWSTTALPSALLDAASPYPDAFAALSVAGQALFLRGSIIALYDPDTGDWSTTAIPASVTGFNEWVAAGDSVLLA